MLAVPTELPQLGQGEVRLRALEPDDAPAVVEACRDPAIPLHTYMESGLDVDGAVAWIERASELWRARSVARFAVVDEDDRLLGQCGLQFQPNAVSAEGFYWGAPWARGRGVVTTAVGRLLDWAFGEVGVERVTLHIHVGNAPSAAVARRLGFTHEGVLRSYEPFGGGRPDVESWSLLPSDPRLWHR